MKDENYFHIQFDYYEALQSKKDVLNSEKNLLKIALIIRHYRVLREKELKIKQKLHRRLKELNTETKKLQTIFPKLKIPKILQKKEEEKPKEKPIKIKEEKKPKVEEKYSDELEMQLKEIQDKLNKLQ